MIEIKNIHKSFGKQHVLKGVDLIAKPGFVQALLGANGTGKSTLIHIISAIMKLEKGEFFIDNEKITIESYTYRSKVGYVFETPIFIENFSAKEYLTFVAKMYKIPKNEYTVRISELLSFFDLPDDKKRILEYSKGMQNKVSLAAALIHKPKYLILDEPFDGIDFVGIQKISKLFKTMAQSGATVFVTSHQFDVIAAMCDNFALLKEGKILFNYSFTELETFAKQQCPDSENPVKVYLENLMTNDLSKTNLSWLNPVH
jgi:ABC-2 type transport system ATP-binding protein